MVTTNYIWDVTSDNVVMEQDDVGATRAVYTQEPSLYGDLISQRRSGSSSYYHYDGNANTLALTDDSETVTDTYDYEAFGVEAAQSGSTENSYRFGGELGYQYDAETADYSVRMRPYRPTRGRWLSKDSLQFIDSMNSYAYATNAVVSTTDPSGLSSRQLLSCELCGLMAVVAPVFGVGGFDAVSIYKKVRVKKDGLLWQGVTPPSRLEMARYLLGGNLKDKLVRLILAADEKTQAVTLGYTININPAQKFEFCKDIKDKKCFHGVGWAPSKTNAIGNLEHWALMMHELVHVI